MKTIRSQSGFTLVELLIVILLVATFTFLAAPRLRGVGEAAVRARDWQNAQKLAAVCASAQAAGLDFVEADGDVRETVGNLMAGGVVERGAFRGQAFQVVLGPAEAESAVAHLIVRDGLLLYVPTGAGAGAEEKRSLRSVQAGRVLGQEMVRAVAPGGKPGVGPGGEP